MSRSLGCCRSSGAGSRGRSSRLGFSSGFCSRFCGWFSIFLNIFTSSNIFIFFDIFNYLCPPKWWCIWHFEDIWHMARGRSIKYKRFDSIINLI